MANVDKGKEIAAILERKQRKGVAELEVPREAISKCLSRKWIKEIEKMIQCQLSRVGKVARSNLVIAF